MYENGKKRLVDTSRDEEEEIKENDGGAEFNYDIL
jgi:hypothetical protein